MIELLTPAIPRKVIRIHSHVAVFMVTFLGGVLAGSVLYISNAYSLGRLRRDIWFILFCVLVGLMGHCAILFMFSDATDGTTQLQLNFGISFSLKILGMGICGAFLYRHRIEFKIADEDEDLRKDSFLKKCFIFMVFGSAEFLICRHMYRIISGII